jgi:hypothetical protein
MASPAEFGILNGILEQLNDVVTRDAAVLHRDAVATADKLSVPANPTLTKETVTGGLLAPATDYKVAVAAYNRWGCTTPSEVQTGGTVDGNALRVAFTAVENADGYDIFLSLDAAPKWVARITEAQRAAGGIITEVGGAPAAGGAVDSIDIGVVGTGAATTDEMFTQNSAYTPIGAGISSIDCAGKSKAYVHATLNVTDLRSTPALSVVPFMLSSGTPNDYHQGTLQALPMLGAAGQSLKRVFVLDVDGATGLKILVDTVSGQGATADVVVELV